MVTIGSELRTLMWFVIAFCCGTTARADIKFGFAQAVLTNKYHLFIPVSVNHSAPTWWLLDTGFPFSVIDPGFAKQLSLSTPGRGGTEPSLSVVGKNKSRTPTVTCQDLQVGTLDCGGVVLREISLETFAAERGITWHGSFNKAGIIGVDILAKYGALINCRLGQVFFSPQGNLGMSPEKYEAQGFTAVPLSVTKTNRLEINGTLGDQAYSFILDTGSPASLFDNGVRNAAHVPFWQTKAPVRAPFAKVNGSKISLAPVSDFRLGSYDARGAFVEFAAFSWTEPGLDHPYGGLIGADFLGYRSAIIDIGGRALYLKPSTNPR